MSENIIQYVVAAGNGDTDAMAKLYSKTLKASYFLASTLCGDKQEAAEITKKAYARAFCNIDKLKKPEAFEIWMKQNVAAAYRETRKFVFSDADAGAVENSSEFLPEAVLSDADLGEKVIKAVAGLRPELKTALVLYYNNGMPVQILAKFLGVSESTSNALIGKARSVILSETGLALSTESADGELPVITRLFQSKAAEVVIDGVFVRDIFLFAIEAYKEVNPVQPEAEKTAEPEAEAEETEAADTQDTTEEPVKAEDDEPVQAELDIPDEETESEAEEEPEKLPDNVLSFKQRISEILDGAPPVEITSSAKENKSDDANTEILIPELEVAPEVPDDVMSDFGAISISKEEKEEPEETPIPKAKPYPVSTKPPVKKNTKKLEPKMIIIAVVAVLVILGVAGGGLALILSLVNGSGDKNVVEPEGYSWQSGGFAGCSEIGYLDESAAYFKSAETGKYGLMDYQGNVILQPVYDGFERCSVGREYDDTDNYHSLVVIGNEKFEITVTGSNVVISETPHLYHSIPTSTLEGKSYDERDRYFEGYAAACKNDKWGYVSQETDKKVISYKYEAVNVLAPGETAACDYCRPVTDGLVAVKKDGNMGIINLDEDEIVPFEYSNIMPGSDGVFIACKGGIWGVILVGEAQNTFTGVKFNIDTVTGTTPDDKDAIGKYKVTGEDGANVREDAGADFEQVGELANGEVVNGYAKKQAENGKTWIKVKVDSGFGWVALSNLEEVE
ncbi:MAG: WG repeat-containing protein [Acutalibacteraceae bacterium]|nr:WG repeat-containing protein [Acutalibacteraceae bacterium]